MFISLGFTGAEAENFSRGMVWGALGWVWLGVFLSKVCVKSEEKIHEKETIKIKCEEGES